MTGLRIRLYNVLFGDAVLVTTMAARKADRQHILIDVGNVLSGKGGKDEVFAPIFADIAAETGGEVDLYVMTHEHLDHVQGLYYAAERLETPVRAKHVWITASADPDYYDTHPDARKKRMALQAAYAEGERLMALRGNRFAAFAAMMANNNPRDTGQCIDHIRNGVATSRRGVKYVSRGANVANAHGIKGAAFEILAPEEDTSEYYGRSRPFAIGDVGDFAGGGPAGGARITPPPGVDAGAFADLLRAREDGFLDSLLQIDKAANNTSVVIRMTYGDKTLMFAGDAEDRSWKFMSEAGLLAPVDFLKLGHHGSHNGMPLDYLDDLFPQGGAGRHIGLSTCTGCYNNVPQASLLRELGRRAMIHDTRTTEPGDFIDIRLET